MLTVVLGSLTANTLFAPPEAPLKPGEGSPSSASPGYWMMSGLVQVLFSGLSFPGSVAGVH